jgi:hypothetical protein
VRRDFSGVKRKSISQVHYFSGVLERFSEKAAPLWPDPSLRAERRNPVPGFKPLSGRDRRAGLLRFARNDGYECFASIDHGH